MLVTFFNISVRPPRWKKGIISSLLLAALAACPSAYAEDFLICNQRPRGLESVASKNPSVFLVSGTSGRHTSYISTHISAGCSYSPLVTYASLSSGHDTTDAAARISELATVLRQSSNLHPDDFKPLRIVITPDAAPNAFIRKGSELRITSGMLKHLETPADAAFLVAHELAHSQLQHPRNASTADEIEADSQAVFMLERAGISPCGAPQLVARVLAANARHTGLSQRRTQALLERISGTCRSEQKTS